MTPLVFALLAAAAAATPAASASVPAIVGPTFDVGGAVVLTEEGELEVRVDLTNRGDAASGGVSVVGELAGHYDEARVPAGVAPGATAAARLVFPREVPRPGVYPVVLLLDYAPPAAAGVTPAARSQRAFLLLTLGATAAPPVRIRAPEVTLRDRVLLPVALESADGRAHRIRLRVLSPRGLNPEHLQDEVTVPASGTATVSVPLLRGGVPRPSRQGLLLVAESLDGEVAQASTSTSLVAVEAAADLRPRWRDPFIIAAGLLLAAAAVLEWRHLRRLRQATADPAA
ncbi:MAG TPA: hypothetical protein VFT38_12115 [Vicinamibacteria bacterium]|nr:hypothetical protein [Vicinamibacteria bacterium]